MTDIVERLRKPLLCEETLEQVLDPIAKLYRAGDTGSLPRDIFESFTDDLDCERAEAAALIASQARRIAELDAEIAALKEGKFWRDELLRASIEDRKRAIAALRRLDARFVEAEADTNSETGTLGETFATIDVSHLRKITTAAIGCHCGNCTEVSHASDCAVHNAPAMPVGPCDCRARATLKGER